MNENISSILQEKQIVENPKRIKTFEREVSHYILTLCLKDSYEMTRIIKDELVEILKNKFLKNFREMTQNTANKKIEEAVNNFIIKRSEVLKKNEWDGFIREIIEERREARTWRRLSTKNIKKELTESELEWIIDDTNKAKDIMRNLDKYVLNLELAITLAKAWVFHKNDLFPTKKHYATRVAIIPVGKTMWYPDFWIAEDDINYLCDMSAKINKEKKSNHATFDLEDEIDEYFWE